MLTNEYYHKIISIKSMWDSADDALVVVEYKRNVRIKYAQTA